MPRVAYLVHNLGDSAVHRRVAMLAEGGLDVALAGFLRAGDRMPDAAPATLLGITHDAALAQRAGAVLRNLARPARVLHACRGADVIIARNLEMLVLAVLARRRLGVGRVVYECLDIHKTMIGNRPRNRAMRKIERAMLRSVDLIVLSSPAFRRAYFEQIQRVATPTLLVENKLPARAVPAALPHRPAPPPWRIAWFGNLRCTRTLVLLKELVRIAAGSIEVLIAGKPSPAEFPDFARAVLAPGITYVGPYRPEDLPSLYARCHFAWAIDFFEEGLNSTWLLPNRIYEASAFGCVPIALTTVETGHWLAARGAGMLLDQAQDPARIASRITTLTKGDYAAMQVAIGAIPQSDMVFTDDDKAVLRAALLGQ